MRKVLVISVGVCFALWTSMAAANWQKTHWGMSEKQVLNELNSKVSYVSPKQAKTYDYDKAKDEVELTSPYRAGKYKFNAFFFFNKDGSGLSKVRLKLKAFGQMVDLFKALKTKYGSPDENISTQISQSYRWHVRKDDITFVAVGFNVAVIYEPHHVVNTQGL
jgi:hypothetical protein